VTSKLSGACQQQLCKSKQPENDGLDLETTEKIFLQQYKTLEWWLVQQTSLDKSSTGVEIPSKSADYHKWANDWWK